MSSSEKARFGILAPILWLCAIWGLSSIPSDSLNTPKILGFDKLAHIGVYCVLGLLINRAFKGRKVSAPMRFLVYALLLLNAAIDEYHQKFIPGRSVSGWDLLANSIGIISGFVAGWVSRDKSS